MSRGPSPPGPAYTDRLQVAHDNFQNRLAQQASVLHAKLVENSFLHEESVREVKEEYQRKLRVGRLRFQELLLQLGSPDGTKKHVEEALDKNKELQKQIRWIQSERHRPQCDQLFAAQSENRNSWDILRKRTKDKNAQLSEEVQQKVRQIRILRTTLSKAAREYKAIDDEPMSDEEPEPPPSKEIPTMAMAIRSSYIGDVEAVVDVALADMRLSLQRAIDGLSRLSEFFENVKVDLTCPACFGWYKAPITLYPCGHSLCRSCYQPKSGECPECGELEPHLLINKAIVQLCSKGRDIDDFTAAVRQGLAQIEKARAQLRAQAEEEARRRQEEERARREEEERKRMEEEREEEERKRKEREMLEIRMEEEEGSQRQGEDMLEEGKAGDGEGEGGGGGEGIRGGGNVESEK